MGGQKKHKVKVKFPVALVRDTEEMPVSQVAGGRTTIFSGSGSGIPKNCWNGFPVGSSSPVSPNGSGVARETILATQMNADLADWLSL